MSSLLEDTVEQALRLEPRERLQLIERVASAVAHDLGGQTDNELATNTEARSPEHWGEKMDALLERYEPIDFVDPEITDPVEWVKTQREKDWKRRTANWEIDA